MEKIIRFRPSVLDDNETDLIICTGHSNEVLIYQNGEVSFDPIILNTHSLHHRDSKYRIFAHPIGPMLLPWAILMLMDKMNLCWGFWTKPLKSMNGISVKIDNINTFFFFFQFPRNRFVCLVLLWAENFYQQMFF